MSAVPTFVRSASARHTITAADRCQFPCQLRCQPLSNQVAFRRTRQPHLAPETLPLCSGMAGKVAYGRRTRANLTATTSVRDFVARQADLLGATKTRRTILTKRTE